MSRSASTAARRYVVEVGVWCIFNIAVDCEMNGIPNASVQIGHRSEGSPTMDVRVSIGRTIIKFESPYSIA